MTDFRAGEKLFISGLDPDKPERRMGAVYLNDTKIGIRVELVNKVVREVKLDSVWKEPLRMRT